MVGLTVSGKKTADSIRAEAASLFVAHGYEATSLRQIAAQVGVKVGSLYNHIESKEDLLLQIMGETMDDLLSAVEGALAPLTDPMQRLIAFLEVHIRFHAEHAQEVFIGNSELRALPEDMRNQIIGKRREYRRLIEELLKEVAATNQAHLLDARLHAFSIVAKGTHVASWFKPDGDYTLDQIVAVYTKMSLRELQVEDADAVVNDAFARVNRP